LIGVVIFPILIMNLIIAILSNTYNEQESQSNGLYLARILSIRDELSFDENYSSFLTAMSPINALIVPLVPFGVLLNPSPILNNYTMKIQYTVFAFILYIIFLSTSALLLPFAFLKSLIFKLKQIFKA